MTRFGFQLLLQRRKQHQYFLCYADEHVYIFWTNHYSHQFLNSEIAISVPLKHISMALCLDQFQDHLVDSPRRHTDTTGTKVIWVSWSRRTAPIGKDVGSYVLRWHSHLQHQLFQQLTVWFAVAPPCLRHVRSFPRRITITCFSFSPSHIFIELHRQLCTLAPCSRQRNLGEYSVEFVYQANLITIWRTTASRCFRNSLVVAIYQHAQFLRNCVISPAPELRMAW